jgi:cell wall-associated NlpC family hydrolase
MVGHRYVAATAGPSTFDCSGLTMAAWKRAGVNLAHLSYTQWRQTTHVPVSQIKPGDLVFYFGGVSQYRQEAAKLVTNDYPGFVMTKPVATA